MKRLLVWILRAIGGLLLLFALGLGGGYLWLRGSLPETRGTIEIAGFEASVEVLRDADGLVTIRAGGERDAARALGYVHAQDRLWQMDLMRRTGAGRLSEILGSATLQHDRFMRRLGLYRVAEANVAHLSGPVRALFEAYAAGVNAFIAEPGGPLPPEFQLLWYAPEPWRPADSLVWGRLMALQLAGNRRDELRRARLARRLRPEQIDFLWPDYPAGAPVTIPDLAALPGGLAPGGVALDGVALERLGAKLAWDLGDLGDLGDLASNGASNSWVLAGSRTESGRPILANDPHLGLSAPGQW